MSDDNITTFDCPKCSTGKLVKRTNKRDRTLFLGCTNYPTCKYTEKLPAEETNIPDAFDVWQ